MSDSSQDNPASRLAAIRERIHTACKEARKDAAAVSITAVSKKHGAETIQPALAVGHRTFGENRVQEAMAKWPALREKYDGVDLRLIGPLQSNKAKEAVGFFDGIETVDRPKLARVLAEEISAQGRAPSLYIQVNTGEEPQKAGVIPGEVDAFIDQCRKEYQLPIDGLMCIPPIDDAPAPHFALLAKIAARNGLEGLSMGMSGDYEIAVQLGATRVRIGTEIFGLALSELMRRRHTGVR